jgi:hypothetical protein
MKAESTASGIGHDIIAVLDGDVNPFILNDYYQADLDDLQKEHCVFLRNLSQVYTP